MSRPYDVSPVSKLLVPHVKHYWDRTLPLGHMSIGKPTDSTVALVIEILMEKLDILHKTKAKKLCSKRPDFIENPDAIPYLEENVKEMLKQSVKDNFKRAMPLVIDTGVDDPFEVEEPSKTIKEITKEKKDKEADILKTHAYYMSSEDFNDAKTKEVPQANRAVQIPQLHHIADPKEKRKTGIYVGNNLDILAYNMPNFDKVIKQIKAQALAKKNLDMPIKLSNMLLVGPPGVGKTKFLKDLSIALNIEYSIIQNNFDLVHKIAGTSAGWSTSRPGDLIKKLADMQTFNPIICIDEIDKVSKVGNNFGDLHTYLLNLLERETAEHIQDNYLCKNLNMSNVNFIFTCNSIDDIPDLLLSRLDVYNIDNFTYEQSLKVSKLIVQEIIKDDFNNHITSVHDNVYEMLTKYESPRVMRRSVFLACAHTIANEQTDLTVEYLEPIGKKAERSIGFM